MRPRPPRRRPVSPHAVDPEAVRRGPRWVDPFARKSALGGVDVGIFGGGGASAPPPPPPPPNPATLASSSVQQAGAAQRAAVAAAAGAGFDDTITNAGGAEGVRANTAMKATLGG